MSVNVVRHGATKCGGDRWASGRVLTAEQRARKREVNRCTARAMKRGMRDKIAELEKRILQLENQKQENTVEDASTDDTTPLGHNNATFGDPTGGLNARDPPATVIEPSFATVNAWSVSGEGSPCHKCHLSDADSIVTTADFPSSPPESRSPKNLEIFAFATARPAGTEITHALNALVHGIRAIPSARICFDDTYNQDVIATAVIQGWEAAFRRYHKTCPIWHMVQAVDSILFKACAFVDRLAVLRMLHKMYLFEVASRSSCHESRVPHWFHPQASQQIVAHEPVIDHIAWPQLREHLILTNKNYLTNQFWASVVSNLRIAWEAPPLASVVSRADTLHGLSPLFDLALQDVSNWRMDWRFAQAFPHLARHVPITNYMPLRTLLPVFGPPLEYSPGSQRAPLDDEVYDLWSSGFTSQFTNSLAYNCEV